MTNAIGDGDAVLIVGTPPGAAAGPTPRKLWIPHKSGLAYFHGLPDNVLVEVADHPDLLPSEPGGVEFWMPTFLNQSPMHTLVGRLPDLRVLQLPSSGSDAWTPLPDSRITLCDARGVHDSATAEWVITAILTSLRSFPQFQRAQAERRWTHDAPAPTGELAGRRVLIVGAGNIGSAVARRLGPFEVEVTMVARTARPADGVRAVADLPDLLPRADVVVLLVPLTDETRGLAGPAFLAAMPDGALLVNAARGPVADAAALYRELESGRLSAVLDVTDPEPLPPSDPLWAIPNVLITPHVAALTESMHDRVYRLAGEQARRYFAGLPLVNRVRPWDGHLPRASA
ncbi:2-hydroxyacid dehydrogenase [Actinoplanes rectilineatus]|uniref:2-hydroxyacid dehydrogenase n=1 Tax=Actinoplanes rectilineatus TaxID=113571 RepID=UPI0009FA0FAE|nr:2-hydroxyacid dehydrogenase [Actinoplanes rectilineatus]